MISVEDFFTTNRAPNDEELEILQHSVSDYRDKLAPINGKIFDLQAQLQILGNEQRAILVAVAPFRRALLPFRRLPEDIIRKIFIACLPIGRNPTMVNTEAPVLLTHISSATRRIALTTPALWTAIHISLEASYRCIDRKEPIMAARAIGVEDWLLRRSGSLPLCISVHHPQYAQEGQNSSKKIIDILMSCCSRWKHVSFDRLPNLLVRISTLVHIDVPILDSLSICHTHSDRYDNQLKSSLIWTTPTLKSLRISGMRMEPDYPVNWSILTHIGFAQMFYGPAGQFLDNTATMLRQTSRLSSCCLYIPGDVQLSNLAEIPLPFLKLLIVSHCVDRRHANYDTEVGGILTSIHAPALEAIQYEQHSAHCHFGTAHEDLIRLLKQTSNLQELHLKNFGTHPVLEECLQYCPSITSLRIDGIYGHGEEHFVKSNALIESFVLDDVTRCLCPQLKYFHCDTHFNLSLVTLCKFVMRKKRPNIYLGRWSTLVLKIIYHPTEEFLLPNIGRLTSKDVIGDIKISLVFRKWTRSYSSLDKGINDPKTREDVWWQCHSRFPTSNM